MTTTTVLSDDTATIFRDDISRFSWGPVVAGAVIATAVTFFLITIGSGLGLALTSARTATMSGAKMFLTLGAIYFVTAQAFGFAVGGHVTGRLMPPLAEESEEENFRADAHGLAVWGLAVVFGLSLVALAALTAASVGASQASPPAAYWADKLLAPSPAQSAAAIAPTPAQATPTSPDNISADQAQAPNGGSQTGIATNVAFGTLADAKAEAARILTVEAASPSPDASNTSELARLARQFGGLSAPAASERVQTTENAMRAKAKATADAARKAASYLGVWTAIALLFGAIVCVTATVSARWKDQHDMFGRRHDVQASM